MSNRAEPNGLKFGMGAGWTVGGCDLSPLTMVGVAGKMHKNDVFRQKRPNLGLSHKSFKKCRRPQFSGSGSGQLLSTTLSDRVMGLNHYWIIFGILHHHLISSLLHQL